MTFRDRFVDSDPDLVYLDGNSLGRLPRASIGRAREIIECQWGDRLIRSWNESWLELPHRIGDKIGRLIGAKPGEVLVTDSTSINLYKLASAALRARPTRREIITHVENFPSDLYVLQGLQRMFPDLVIRFSDDPVADISERTALVTLSHVHFKSGYRYPMEAINQAARQKGAWTLWDLSHSVGAVPIDLSTADLAIGCTYKYMNGGPGAPAFLYVHQDLANLLRNPIQGWFGQKNAFEFGMTYEPAAGLDRFAVGTPSVISTALIEPGVDLLLEAGIEWIDERRTLLTQRLIEARLEDFGFDCVTPTLPEQRGSHVTFTHEDAWRINLALIDAKVIPDFRSPNYLRFGIAPLYNDETDIDLALARLRDIMTSQRYEGYPTARPVVT